MRRFLLAFALLAGSSPASGAPTPSFPPVTAALPALAEEARLLPVGDALGDDGDSFGASVAADGDTLAIGVPGHDLPTFDAGCAMSMSTSGAQEPGHKPRS